MMKRPWEWVKLEDMATDLLSPRSRKETAFDRAYQDLVACGRLEIIGNEVRINQ